MGRRRGTHQGGGGPAERRGDTAGGAAEGRGAQRGGGPAEGREEVRRGTQQGALQRGGEGALQDRHPETWDLGPLPVLGVLTRPLRLKDFLRPFRAS